MNDHRFSSRIVVACVILGTLSCVPATQGPSQTPTKLESLPTVATVQPKRIDLVQKSEQPGQVEAYSIVEIFPKVSGYLSHLAVDIGSQVEANQLLATLHAPELLDDVRQQQALMEQVQSQLEQARAAISVALSMEQSAEANQREVQATVSRYESEVARWKSETSRLIELASKKSITQKVADEAIQQRDAAQSTLLEAQARVQSIAAKFNEAKAMTLKAEADQRAKLAELAIAQAQWEHAKTMASYLEIRAPFAGVVSQRGYDVGALVTHGRDKTAQPLLTVAEYLRVRVLVEVPEADAHLIENGRRVNVRLPALGNRLFEGVVSRSAWGLTEGTRTLRCEVDLPNEDGKLRHRMYAKMELLVAERPNALTIPRTAVVMIDGVPHCLIVRSGEIERIPLKLGISNPTDIEVLDGLSGSEQVVSANVAAFQPGQKVRTP